MAETIAPEEAFRDITEGMPDLDKLGNEIIAAAQGALPFGALLHRDTDLGPLITNTETGESEEGPEEPKDPDPFPLQPSTDLTSLG